MTTIFKADAAGALEAEMTALSLALESARGAADKLEGALADETRLGGPGYDAARSVVSDVCVPALDVQCAAMESLARDDEANAAALAALPDDPSPLDDVVLQRQKDDLETAISSLQDSLAGTVRFLYEHPCPSSLDEVVECSLATEMEGWTAAMIEEDLAALEKVTAALAAMDAYRSATSGLYKGVTEGMAGTLSSSSSSLGSLAAGNARGDTSWAVDAVKEMIYDGTDVDDAYVRGLLDKEPSELTNAELAALYEVYGELVDKAINDGSSSELDRFVNDGYAQGSTEHESREEGGGYAADVVATTYSMRPGFKALLEGYVGVTQTTKPDDSKLLAALVAQGLLANASTYSVTQVDPAPAYSDAGSVAGNVHVSVGKPDGKDYHVGKVSYGGTVNPDGTQADDLTRDYYRTAGQKELDVFYDSLWMNNLSNAENYLGSVSLQTDPAVAAVGSMLDSGRDTAVSKMLEAVGAAKADPYVAAGEAGLDGWESWNEAQEFNARMNRVADVASLATGDAHNSFVSAGGFVVGSDGSNPQAVSYSTKAQEEAYTTARNQYDTTEHGDSSFEDWLSDNGGSGKNGPGTNYDISCNGGW